MHQEFRPLKILGTIKNSNGFNQKPILSQAKTYTFKRTMRFKNNSLLQDKNLLINREKKKPYILQFLEITKIATWKFQRTMNFRLKQISIRKTETNQQE